MLLVCSLLTCRVFYQTHCFFVGYLGDFLVEAASGEVVDKAGFSALLRDVRVNTPDRKSVVFTRTMYV